MHLRVRAEPPSNHWSKKNSDDHEGDHEDLAVESRLVGFALLGIDLSQQVRRVSDLAEEYAHHHFGCDIAAVQGDGITSKHDDVVDVHPEVIVPFDYTVCCVYQQVTE